MYLKLYSIQCLIILSFIILYYVKAFHKNHRVSCNFKQLCNGNLMCANVCERGSVDIDSWSSNSLAYQRKLQRYDDMVYFEMPSTHNSAITEADGFGIEKYFISALGGGIDLDEGDDMREGVCQYLSITDQLRMGIRHIEIDVWWDALLHEIVVCHTPVISPGKVAQVNIAAEAANLTLIWDPKNTSCRGTKRDFIDVLTEINDWLILDENLEEIVLLFIDTKFYLSPEHVTQANDVIRNAFGSKLWTYMDGSPLAHKVDELISNNKRVIIENNKDDWLFPSQGDAIVFFPTLWTHQFNSVSFEEFPNCTVEGDKTWYGSTWVRALADDSMTEPGTRCGVQFSSQDYTNPDEMKFYVWSWDQKEPSLSDGCVAMLPSGRWATLDCNMKLPYACLSKSNEIKSIGYDLDWMINLEMKGNWNDGENACQGLDANTNISYIYSAPHNGYSNAILLNKAYAQTIWLNAPNPKM